MNSSGVKVGEPVGRMYRETPVSRTVAPAAMTKDYRAVTFYGFDPVVEFSSPAFA